MRVGLIADTHIPRDVKKLPPHVLDAFQGVDLILHAGDIYLPSVIDELETIATVLAARGNGDWQLPKDQRLKDSHVLNIDGLRLGLAHAIPYMEMPWSRLIETMEKVFGGPTDIVVFGDTHVALVERHRGILLVNPGSPTLPNGLFQLGTVALLDITDGQVDARIVQLSEIRRPFEKESFYHRGLGA